MQRKRQISNRSFWIVLALLATPLLAWWVMYRLEREEWAAEELAKLRREEQTRIEKQRDVVRHAIRRYIKRDDVTINFADPVSWFQGEIIIQENGVEERYPFYATVLSGRIDNLKISGQTVYYDGRLVRNTNPTYW